MLSLESETRRTGKENIKRFFFYCVFPACIAFDIVRHMVYFVRPLDLYHRTIKGPLKKDFNG
jgi:hypothetical protein